MNTYLLTVLIPNFGLFLGCFSILGLIVLVIYTCVCFSLYLDLSAKSSSYYNEELEQFNRFKKFLKPSWIVILLCMFLACLFPTEEQMKQLVIINTLKDTKGLDKIPENLVARINDLLKPSEKK